MAKKEIDKAMEMEESAESEISIYTILVLFMFYISSLLC